MSEDQVKECKVSVITVCYNASTTIERTIQSIIDQTHKNIEYIIIDGGSNDGTIDIIQRYNKYIEKYNNKTEKYKIEKKLYEKYTNKINAMPNIAPAVAPKEPPAAA